MNCTNALDSWIHAAAEAAHDFSGQMLGLDESDNVYDIKRVYDDVSDSLPGSCIALSCGEDLIEISFLSQEEVLTKIGRLMLVMSPEEELRREDMMDAIKEAINIISGGVKCRLNNEVTGGILLGLPTYSEQKKIHNTGKESIAGMIHVANMPVLLSVNRIR